MAAKRDYTLGRIKEHDPRSKLYRVNVEGVEIASVRWNRQVPVFDQGDLGSCTANAGVGVLATDPFYSKTSRGSLVLDEAFAVEVYKDATRLDDFDGEYLPTDTGSSGLAVAKALKARGLISGYTHAFSLDDALKALQLGPVIIGINWYRNFFTPTKTGMISVGVNDYVVGGHEVLLDEVDVEKRIVGGTNSWGDSWGVNGRFYMTFDLLARLMLEDGDVTSFVPVTMPAPEPAPVPVPAPPAPEPEPPTTIDPEDAELWRTQSFWAHARHVGSNQKAANAVIAWAKAKGLSE